ncbi:MAG TPA: porin, partial [Gemmatimonadales bacterium]|nr:porin [Gemmatimonadales bacterium]
ITRAYLNVLGKFAYGINTRVTADIYRNTDGSLAYRLKYAFASWTPNDGKSPLTFKLGQIHTPWLDWEEHLWDYRMQGSMAMERAGYVSSSDFGAGIDGMFDFDRFNFQIGVYNGENYNKAPGDQRKDLMGRASFRILGTDEGGRDGGLRLTGYAQYGKPTGGGARQRYIGMLSYRSKVLTLAAEAAATKDSVTDPVGAEKKGRVLSFFGVLRVPRTKLQVIGRLDSTDPNTDADDDRSTRFIGGVAYQHSGNLRVLAGIDHVDRTAPALEAFRSQALLQVQFTF